MPIEVIQTEIADILVIKPQIYEDERGYFYESFNRRDWLAATGIDCEFVQDNHSFSRQGVLRGLHYQLPPAAQGKLVRVLVGEIFDVAVDLRKDSLTFGRWVGRILSADNRLQMWLPQGFAHGFLVLSDTAEVLYKATDYYAPACEQSILWNDADLAITWPLTALPELSAKDAAAKPFRQVGI